VRAVLLVLYLLSGFGFESPSTIAVEGAFIIGTEIEGRFITGTAAARNCRLRN
jgi:hypothetical protein